MQDWILLVDVIVEWSPDGPLTSRIGFFGLAPFLGGGHQAFPGKSGEEDGVATFEAAVFLSVQRAAAQARVMAQRTRPVVIITGFRGPGERDSTVPMSPLRC